MTRRRFLKAGAVAAASTAGAVGLAHSAPRQVRLTRHRMSWPAKIPLTVAHVTDLHVGWGTPGHLLDHCVRLCEAAEPDLVVLTGDYLNRSVGHLPALSRLLARLPRPCVATLGNHDHWSGADAIERALEQQGVTVLRNDRTRVRVGCGRVTVVGVDDGRTKHDDVTRAFAGLSDPESALVLTHTPTTADEIAARGGRTILAGHTHGGQVEVPVLTTAIARLSGNKYIGGWYELGPSRLYVNAGIGTSGLRLRVGPRTRPEVALMELS